MCAQWEEWEGGAYCTKWVAVVLYAMHGLYSGLTTLACTCEMHVDDDDHGDHHGDDDGDDDGGGGGVRVLRVHRSVRLLSRREWLLVPSR